MIVNYIKPAIALIVSAMLALALHAAYNRGANKVRADYEARIAKQDAANRATTEKLQATIATMSAQHDKAATDRVEHETAIVHDLAPQIASLPSTPDCTLSPAILAGENAIRNASELPE